jgi:hypothetical protein
MRTVIVVVLFTVATLVGLGATPKATAASTGPGPAEVFTCRSMKKQVDLLESLWKTAHSQLQGCLRCRYLHDLGDCIETPLDEDGDCYSYAEREAEMFEAYTDLDGKYRDMCL